MTDSPAYLRRLEPAPEHLIVSNTATLITNHDGNGNRGNVSHDAYILIEGGRFSKIGRIKDLARERRSEIAGQGHREISAVGNIVTPGFMLGHTHLCQTLWRGRGGDKQSLEWLRDHTGPGEAAFTERDIAIAAHLGVAEVLLHGATAVRDMGTVHHSLAYARDGIAPSGLRNFTPNVVTNFMDPMGIIEALARLGFLGRHTFLYHVIHATPEEMTLLAQSGTTAVYRPWSNGVLGSGIAPIWELLELGASVAIGGARDLGLNGQIGRIAPSYRADFVRWSLLHLANMIDLERARDIIDRLVHTTDATNDVFREGQAIVRDGQPLFIADMEAFREEMHQTPIELSTSAASDHVPITFFESPQTNPHVIIQTGLDEFFRPREGTSLAQRAEALNTLLRGQFVEHAAEIVQPEICTTGCMDEGVPEAAISLGGSGIMTAYYLGLAKELTGWEGIVASIPNIAALLGSSVDVITSHQDCGAARLIYQGLPEADRTGFTGPDDLVIVFAQLLWRELQKLNPRAQYKHLPFSAMTRKTSFHPAPMVFYSGARRFLIDSVIPPNRAFKISRGVLEALSDSAFASVDGDRVLDTACSIALGALGLGSRLTTETPLIIVPVGGDLMGREALKAEAERVAGRHTGRVRVLDGFTLKPQSTEPHHGGGGGQKLTIVDGGPTTPQSERLAIHDHAIDDGTTNGEHKDQGRGHRVPKLATRGLPTARVRTRASPAAFLRF